LQTIGRLPTVTDWAFDWRRDQMDIVEQLEDAIKTMDYDAFCSATGQLKAVTEKRFTGLQTVLDRLIDDD
jgi:hypothetical protein